MIDYIKGILTELQPARAVVECAGVGYDINISLTTFAAIQGKTEVKLYINEQIREDAWTLYGFASRGEREVFTMLTAVSGVGAGTARMMLSSLSPQELADTIASEQVQQLKLIKGIGLKTAQRIIVELKDKMATIDLGQGTNMHTQTVERISEAGEEAIKALTMLGFAPAASKKVVVALLKEDATLPAEAIIKRALKELH